MSTADQVAALRSGELDIGLLRERPSGGDLDAIKVLEERLGVLLAAERGAELSGPEGVRLDSLAGLHWVGFPAPEAPSGTTRSPPYCADTASPPKPPRWEGRRCLPKSSWQR